MRVAGWFNGAGRGQGSTQDTFEFELNAAGRKLGLGFRDGLTRSVDRAGSVCSEIAEES
jgi:hypothetical protein